ncbi:MAG: hypothetical protein IT337_07200 [Thermomicrobiales bacterium]|nr:hypothetical protein [Thermomicrobiales bacterium]
MLVRWQPRLRRSNTLVVLLLTGGIGWVVYRAIGIVRQPLPEATGAGQGERPLDRTEPAGLRGAPPAAARRGPAGAATEPSLTWRGVPEAAAGAAGLASSRAAKPAGTGTGAGAGAPAEPNPEGALNDLGLRTSGDAALPEATAETTFGAADIREDTALGGAMRDTGDRERDLAPPTAAPAATGPHPETIGEGVSATPSESGASAREGGSSAPAATAAPRVAPLPHPHPANRMGIFYDTPEAMTLSPNAEPPTHIVGGEPTSTGIPRAEVPVGVPIHYAETPVEDLIAAPPAPPSDPNVIVPHFNDFPAGGTTTPIEDVGSAAVPVEVKSGENAGPPPGAAQPRATGGDEAMATPSDALVASPHRELAALPATDSVGKTGAASAASAADRASAPSGKETSAAPPAAAPSGRTGSEAVGIAAAAQTAAGGGTTPVISAEDHIRPHGGICPDTYPIKGNAGSMIFHEPGSGSYNQTVPEVCFRDAAAAEAAGYRRSIAAIRADRAVGLGAVADTIATAIPPSETQEITQPMSSEAREEARAEAARNRQPASGGATPAGRTRATPVPQGAVAGDGSHDCPADHPIKGNASSRLFHKPGQLAYERTIPELCFAAAEDAENAGYRAAKQ